MYFQSPLPIFKGTAAIFRMCPLVQAMDINCLLYTNKITLIFKFIFVSCIMGHITSYVGSYQLWNLCPHSHIYSEQGKQKIMFTYKFLVCVKFSLFG